MSIFYRVVLFSLVAAFALDHSAVGAEDTEIKQFEKLLSRQSEQLADQQKMLDAQNRQLHDLQSQLDALNNNKVTATPGKATQTKRQKNKSTPSSSQTVAQTPQNAPTSPQQQTQTASAKPRLKEMPKDTRPPEIPRVSADIGGVLTPKGRTVVEPTVQYSYSKSQRVNIAGFTVTPILFGIFNVRDVRRETETVALTGRYGLTDRIELEARVPFVRREDTAEARPVDKPATNSDFFRANALDIGDIEFAGHYQINDGKNGWPFFIGNLRVKSDTGTSPYDIVTNLKYNLPTKLNTGTGFWSFQPSVTAIFPTDPAVFFANVSYLWNLEGNVPARIGGIVPDGKGGNTLVKHPASRIDPGDAIGFSFGTSLAYNEKASFSLGYSHTVYFKTTDGGINIEGTDVDVGQFTFGLNYAFAKKTSANLAVAIGATRDAPDVQLTLRVPFGFDLQD
jgi:hypothetical protein